MSAVVGTVFDQAGFEAGIRAAMQMGQPPNTADRPIFYFPPAIATTAPTDGRGVPFNPAATAMVVNLTPPAEGILCAMEFGLGSDRATRLGRLDESPLTITFLDAEYQNVKGAQYLEVAGVRYDFDSVDGPLGLFTSAVWITHWNAHGGKVATP